MFAFYYYVFIILFKSNLSTFTIKCIDTIKLNRTIKTKLNSNNKET